MSNYSSGRGFDMPPAVKTLLIITVALFLIPVLASFFHYEKPVSDVMSRMHLYNVHSKLFFPTQFITYMFLHANFGHLFFNMFGLFMFGRVLEMVWGSKKMILFYLLTGVGAAVINSLIDYIQTTRMINIAQSFLSTPNYELFSDFVERFISKRYGSFYTETVSFMQSWFYEPQNTSFIPQAKEIVNSFLEGKITYSSTIGASGAIFGLLAAFAMMFPNVELMLIFLPIPIKAKYLVPVYAIIELVFGVAGFEWDNVAHFAHLGGALVGFIVVRYWKRKQFNNY
jgi:membrane associated rhomboid family serine protease